MSAPFRLRVEPAATEESARVLRRAAAALDAVAGGVAAVGSQLAASWQGPAAQLATAEVHGLGRVLGRGPERLAAAAGALDALADAQRHAVDVAVPDLVRRWEQAEQEHRQAVARAAATQAVAHAGDALAAEQARLRRAFDDVRSDLAERTRATGARLGEAVLVAVHPLAGALSATGPLGALLSAVVGADLVRSFAADLPLSALAAAARRPPDDLAASRALLDQARRAGLPPERYAPALERFWLLTALDRAGIDRGRWDPARGAAELRDVVGRVYRYYGDLFLADRDLQWAGMANAIGPSFAAGFADLAMFRAWAREVQRLPVPVGVPGHLVDAAATLSDRDLRQYEERFLLMQRRIFDDQAPPHEAYRTGGIEAVREMVAAGLLSPATARAWEDIASGDADRVAAGNREHLRREQHEVIARDYDWMRSQPTGLVVTWGATLLGAPSIPGARSFAEVFPLEVRVPSPGIESVFGVDNPLQVDAVVTTPLPDGNLSVLRDRWALITDDTLPAYQRLLADPDAAAALAAQPVSERIAQHRLQEQWDDLLLRLATSTRVRVEQ